MTSVSPNAATETTNTVFGKERGFHAFAEVPYPLPSDQEEMSRLNGLQDLVKVLFHKNVLAPIQDSPGINIIDLGTGSGKWAIEVAEEFPHATVRGFDLSANQPKDLPPNCSFYQYDFIKALQDHEQFPDGSLDLVHMRQVRAGIKKDQWPLVLGNIYRVLKPGGWAQVGEHTKLSIDPAVQPPSKSYLWQFSQLNSAWHEKTTSPVMMAGDQKRLLEEAGFVDIQVTNKWIDAGCFTNDPDAKKAGQLAKFAHGAAFPVLGMLFAPGETEEEKREWVQKCLDELHSGKSPTGTQVHQIIGRKPAKSE